MLQHYTNVIVKVWFYSILLTHLTTHSRHSTNYLQGYHIADTTPTITPFTEACFSIAPASSTPP